MMFHDRVDAGRQLAALLKKYEGQENTVLIALPRGGVIVACELAQSLELPLDIVVPRKVGAPENPEFAIGAVTEDGDGVFNEEAIRQLGVTEAYIAEESARERREAERRRLLYRGGRPPLHLHGKTVILVDDGIATGATMRAAIRSVKQNGAAQVVVAVPVAARETVVELSTEADDVVCIEAPALFGAVGAFYEHFPQITDEEVVNILEDERHRA